MDIAKNDFYKIRNDLFKTAKKGYYTYDYAICTRPLGWYHAFEELCISEGLTIHQYGKYYLRIGWG